jgi:hypothetical protein
VGKSQQNRTMYATLAAEGKAWAMDAKLFAVKVLTGPRTPRRTAL